MPLLIIEKGKDKGKSFELAHRPLWSIGRDKSCNIVLSDAMASRRHAEIEKKTNGHYIIRDLKSSNGTKINGHRIQKHTLEFNDKIEIGATIFSYLSNYQDLKGTSEFKSGRLGGYQLIRRLGRGGMGTVYLAKQLSLNRNVAIKILSKEYSTNKAFVEMFIKEARAAGALNHPNIVQVYDVGKEGTTYYFSMEYMSNGSVEDLLRNKEKLELQEAIHIIREAAKGLEYAEKKRIIHRDIKPANIMLHEENLVKIGDLGIAYRLQEHAKSAELEEISGSPHYIAPEHALSQPIDHRVDIYALGITFYELLSGHPPYTGHSPQEIILKHVEEEPPPLKKICPEIPQAVCQIIHKMIAKNPNARFQSASEITAALDNFCQKQIEDSANLSNQNPPNSQETSNSTQNKQENIPIPYLKKQLHLIFPLLVLLAIFSASLFKKITNINSKNKIYQYQKSYYQKALDSFSKKNYLKTKKLCMKIIDMEAKSYWSDKAAELLEKTEHQLANLKKQILSQKTKKFNFLKKKFSPQLNLTQLLKLKKEIQNFLLSPLPPTLLAQTKQLYQNVQIQIQSYQNLLLQKRNLEKAAKRKYEEIFVQAQAMAQAERYKDAIDILKSFPSQYQATTYHQRIQMDIQKYIAESKQKFLLYLKNSPILNLYQKLNTMLSKKKYSILYIYLKNWQHSRNWKSAKQDILHKASRYGKPAKKIAKNHIKKIKEKIQTLQQICKQQLKKQELQSLQKMMKKYKTFLASFRLKTALLEVQKHPTPHLQELKNFLIYHQKLTQQLLQLKQKFIQYIHRKGEDSGIGQKKYNGILVASIINADRDKITLLSHNQGYHQTVFWNKIPPKSILNYFLMYSQKENFSSNDYLALALYSFYALNDNEQINSLLQKAKNTPLNSYPNLLQDIHYLKQLISSAKKK